MLALQREMFDYFDFDLVDKAEASKVLETLEYCSAGHSPAGSAGLVIYLSANVASRHTIDA